MTVRDDLEAVVRLACLIEDRTDQEQRSLLRTARKVDDQSNRNVVGNRRMWGENAGTVDAEQQRPLSDLEQLAEETRRLSDWPGDGQHEVHLKPRKPRLGGT